MSSASGCFPEPAAENLLYCTVATVQTYEKLAQGVQQTLDGGFTAIVDAAFLRQQNRDEFRRLAEELGVPFVILNFNAPVEVLRDRVKRRHDDFSDADLSVLEKQLGNHEPLADQEQTDVVGVNTGKAVEIEDLIGRIHQHS